MIVVDLSCKIEKKKYITITIIDGSAISTWQGLGEQAAICMCQSNFLGCTKWLPLSN